MVMATTVVAAATVVAVAVAVTAMAAAGGNYDLDSEFADELLAECNLRECATAALDVLVVRFGTDLLAVLLGLLKDKLWGSQWLERESASLALSAMADGMFQYIISLMHLLMLEAQVALKLSSHTSRLLSLTSLTHSIGMALPIIVSLRY